MFCYQSDRQTILSKEISPSVHGCLHIKRQTSIDLCHVWNIFLLKVDKENDADVEQEED